MNKKDKLKFEYMYYNGYAAGLLATKFVMQDNPKFTKKQLYSIIAECIEKANEQIKITVEKLEK